MKWFRLSITVPTVKQPEWPMAVFEVQERMLETFGGYSMTEQLGAWRGKDQDHHESSVVIECYAQDWAQQEIVWPFMKDCAKFVKNFMDEEAVLVTIEPVERVHFL